MSAERADRLLRAYGQRGPYAVVGIEKTRRNPDGAWCFLNVQISDHDGGGTTQLTLLTCGQGELMKQASFVALPIAFISTSLWKWVACFGWMMEGFLCRAVVFKGRMVMGERAW